MKKFISNTQVFYIMYSKHELNRQQGLYIQKMGLKKPIYSYTNQANINKSISNKTNENLYYIFKKQIMGTQGCMNEF